MPGHTLSTARTPGLRVALISLILLGTVFSTAASCKGTTTKCVNGNCTISFNNGATSTTVDSLDGAELTIRSVSGDNVGITLGGQSIDLVEGRVTEFGSLELTATEVSPDKITIEIS